MALLYPFALAAVLSTGLRAQTTADAFTGSRQLLVAVTPSWAAVDGNLQRYERSADNKPWQPVGSSIPIVVGKHGLGWGSGLAAPASAGDPIKKEGDGKSPAGIFALGTSFGYADAKPFGSRLPYLSLTPSIECVDDASSKFYNRIVDRSAVTPDWNSSEHMRNTGESYRLGIVVDHNAIADGSSAKPVTNGGSCIFLHIWQGAGHGTAGCTAMAPVAIESLFQWIDPKRRPLLVQLTADDYARLMTAWHLPTVTNLPAR
ncbi:MAG: hypothetical protein PW789_15620 [Edaphobacter sp.]|uniref:L,D-transpeptidase family protein n=1 Tax=Edaphobacter sp. TaxID=1934404 RepID=UPI00238FA0EF|nr:L,D-transpeptidase family protein [Edaphobacter sp.]MDE1178007.1 hypothetical protein [Edaphobacter sp.]